jgi:hypothetical protein
MRIFFSTLDHTEVLSAAWRESVTKDREKVVPASSDPEAAPGEPIATRRNYRLSCAALLARTFGLKLERCSLCGGEMKVFAVVTHPSSIRRYLVLLCTSIVTSSAFRLHGI